MWFRPRNSSNSGDQKAKQEYSPLLTQPERSGTKCSQFVFISGLNEELSFASRTLTMKSSYLGHSYGRCNLGTRWMATHRDVWVVTAIITAKDSMEGDHGYLSPRLTPKCGFAVFQGKRQAFPEFLYRHQPRHAHCFDAQLLHPAEETFSIALSDLSGEHGTGW